MTDRLRPGRHRASCPLPPYVFRVLIGRAKVSQNPRRVRHVRRANARRAGAVAQSPCGAPGGDGRRVPRPRGRGCCQSPPGGWRGGCAEQVRHEALRLGGAGTPRPHALRKSWAAAGRPFRAGDLRWKCSVAFHLVVPFVPSALRRYYLFASICVHSRFRTASGMWYVVSRFCVRFPWFPALALLRALCAFVVSCGSPGPWLLRFSVLSVSPWFDSLCVRRSPPRMVYSYTCHNGRVPGVSEED
jgi:hypothetical protein